MKPIEMLDHSEGRPTTDMPWSAIGFGVPTLNLRVLGSIFRDGSANRDVDCDVTDRDRPGLLGYDGVLPIGLNLPSPEFRPGVGS